MQSFRQKRIRSIEMPSGVAVVSFDGIHWHKQKNNKGKSETMFEKIPNYIYTFHTVYSKDEDLTIVLLRISKVDYSEKDIQQIPIGQYYGRPNISNTEEIIANNAKTAFDCLNFIKQKEAPKECVNKEVK